MKNALTIILLFVNLFSFAQLQPLKISSNKRHFVTKNNKPFFWLGDTGWLLFVKCKREEAIQYLDNRKAKGFNVVQVMLVHDINLGVNAYGDSSLINKDVSKPNTTAGSHFNNAVEYDFWDNVDYVIDEAAKRGIYMALVPVWGGNIKNVSVEQAKVYASFLANRYKNKTNIIWLNGGDIKGSDGLEQWNMIGNTIGSIDKNHLIGFHPRGRNSSSTWFHDAPWLDFNMFQSGHRSYAQDTLSTETLHYGEDNWRYANDDYKLTPTKPTFDGEPSYEDIPYGLHRADEPYWQDFEIRRYAYWSVFAGGCGFTYGQNAVMQFYTPGDSGTSYFPKMKWQDGMNAAGASQMQYVKKLILSNNVDELVPDQNLIINQGKRYNYVAAISGKNFSYIYTYIGRNFELNIGKYAGKKVKSSWYNPRNGQYIAIGDFIANNKKTFDPPGEEKAGNDWVLVLQVF
jgi:hypothetical protein